MRVLHVAAELFPLLKIGGLGEVLGALPSEQARQGHSARVLLPGHVDCLEGVRRPETNCPGWEREGRILFGLTTSGIPIYVLDAPAPYGPSENPYSENGHGPFRFSALAKAAAHLASAGDGLGWRPDLVHAHDWTAGLVPAYLAPTEGPHPPTVMTVHNAAYYGLYPPEDFPGWGFPGRSFHPKECNSTDA